MILTLARREWRAGLLTPLGWVLLAANQVVLGWTFLQTLERYTGLEASKRAVGLTVELSLNLWGLAAALTLLSAPLLAARMFGGERQEGSANLLGAAPVSLVDLVLGKYLGLAGLLTLVCLLPPLLALTVVGAVDLDPGLLAAATLGLWLATLLFAAVGLFASTLSAQPGVALLVAYAVLILLSVVGAARKVFEPATGLFDWLSWNDHLLWFLVGAVRLSDIAYFVLFAALFLALAHRRLANRRLA
jgi:ABC-2 type transport system permease protein